MKTKEVVMTMLFLLSTTSTIAQGTLKSLIQNVSHQDTTTALENGDARQLQEMTSAINFLSYVTSDCGACLESSTTATYCYNSQLNTEWCCSANDTTSTNCIASSVVTCSPTRSWGGQIAYTYCKGASDPTGCNVTSTSLTASSIWQGVTLLNFPAYVTVSNKKSYRVCYYQIAPASFVYKTGAQIKL